MDAKDKFPMTLKEKEYYRCLNCGIITEDKTQEDCSKGKHKWKRISEKEYYSLMME